MTDEYSCGQPEEPSLAPSPPAGAAEHGYPETPEYAAASGPPFGPAAAVGAVPVRPPFYRRTGVLFGAAAVAVAVVAGGVGLALSHSSSSSTVSSAASVTGQAPDGQQGGQRGFHHRSHAVVGTIASENGDTWTVNQVDGTTTTVTITPQTRFGTRANQETQSQFAVGSQVAIRGKDADGVLTARWVGQPQDLRHPRGDGAMQTPGAGQPN